MRTPLEATFGDTKERAEALIESTHGDDAIEALFSFSGLDCVVDLKLEAGWIRYVFIQGDDAAGDALRRIG